MRLVGDGGVCSFGLHAGLGGVVSGGRGLHAGIGGDVSGRGGE